MAFNLWILDTIRLILFILFLTIAIPIGLWFQKWVKQFVKESKQGIFGEQATQAFK